MTHTGRRASGGKTRSWSISRVLSWTAIPLGPELLQGSSHLPASSAGRFDARLFGVAPGGGCRVSPLPRPARRCHHSPCRSEPRLVSVALFLAFVARHRIRGAPYGGPAEPKARFPPDGFSVWYRLCPAQLIAGGSYPPPYPVEPGLSSVHAAASRRRFLNAAHSGCLASFALYFTAQRVQGSHSSIRGLE
jgi:hypothetical protein